MIVSGSKVRQPDAYDRVRDAESEARYEVDPQAERDDLWKETLPEKGSNG